APDPDVLPTGHELLDDYLTPLAEALGDRIRTGARVVAVSRDGMDKTRSAHRADTPLLVRITTAGGAEEDLTAQAVLDASGTWNQTNPLGRYGLPAPGETAATAHGLITAPLPDVHGTDRHRFADRHVAVVGAGHSAASTLLDLADLAQHAPETRITRADQGAEVRAADPLLDLAELAQHAPVSRISWVVRGADVSAVNGGEAQDELAARGALGTRLGHLVSTGAIEVHTAFVITGFAAGHNGLTVQATTPAGPTELNVDVLVPATGFRPDLDILSELRLELDPAVEAPRQLGPLID